MASDNQDSENLFEDCPSERQEHCEFAPEHCMCRANQALRAECKTFRAALQEIAAKKPTTDPISYGDNRPGNGNWDDEYSAGFDCGVDSAYHHVARIAVVALAAHKDS